MIDKETIDKIQKANIDIDITDDNFIIIQSDSDIKKIEGLFNKSIDKIFDNWGYSDEYTSCSNCINVIHLITYDKNDYAFINNEIICGNCIRDTDNDFYKDYINDIINNPKRANTILPDNILENEGFKKCNCNNEECNFESGLREGSNDDPKQILNKAIAKNPDKEYIFDVTNIDMFGVFYTIWNRVKQIDESD